MIHLSWSVIQLVVVLVVLWIPYLLDLKLKIRNVSFKRYLIEWLCSIPIVLFFAFDVGTKQEDLQRGKFDAILSQEEIEKKSSERITVEDVNKSFNSELEKR